MTKQFECWKIQSRALAHATSEQYLCLIVIVCEYTRESEQAKAKEREKGRKSERIALLNSRLWTILYRRRLDAPSVGGGESKRRVWHFSRYSTAAAWKQCCCSAVFSSPL